VSPASSPAGGPRADRAPAPSSRGGTESAEPRTAVETWLARRLDEIPADLALAVRRLLGRASGLTDAHMAEASIAGFERVASGAGDRDRALELLAADALLTYAFEAAADPALGGSAARAAALADRFGPQGELGRRCVRRGR